MYIPILLKEERTDILARVLPKFNKLIGNPSRRWKKQRKQNNKFSRQLFFAFYPTGVSGWQWQRSNYALASS